MLSTSSVPGKHTASVVDSSKRIWGDLLCWDPMTGFIEFDKEKLKALLLKEKRKHSPVLLGAAGGIGILASGSRSVMDYFRRHFVNSYGIANIAVAMVFTGLTAVVALPLMAINSMLENAVNRDLNSEVQNVIDQAGAFFSGIQG